MTVLALGAALFAPKTHSSALLSKPCLSLNLCPAHTLLPPHTPHVQCDGMDVLAVRQAFAYAKEYAVANGEELFGSVCKQACSVSVLGLRMPRSMRWPTVSSCSVLRCTDCLQYFCAWFAYAKWWPMVSSVFDLYCKWYACMVSFVCVRQGVCGGQRCAVWLQPPVLWDGRTLLPRFLSIHTRTSPTCGPPLFLQAPMC